MSWFSKKKMNEKDSEAQEMNEEIEERIPVNDKRKFNAEGERNPHTETPDPKPAPVNPIIVKLEEEIRIERERREAAEHKLIGVQAKFDELRAQMERETAEMRQRLQRHNEQRMQIEKSEFLASLLPILDNINLAILAAETDSSIEHLLVGVKGTARLFEQTLLNSGVEPIASIGTDFNPEFHEAVEMIEVSEDQDGKIVGEFSRGYKVGERLLRPARVQVGRAMTQKAVE